MDNNFIRKVSTKENFFQDLCIILLIAFIYRIPRMISNIFSLDLPVEEFFWIIPCFGLYILSFLNKKLRLPYFFVFIIIECWFLLSESEIFRPGKSHDLVYAFYMLQFYSIFIGFVACGITKLEKILKYSVIILIPFILIFYLNYFNIISLNVYDSIEKNELDLSVSRLTVGNLISINGISFNASYGILATILLFIIGDKFIKKYVIFLFVYFLGIIILHATRGAFIISLLIIILFIYKIWSGISRISQIVIFFLLVIVIFFQFFSETPIYKAFYIFERFSDEHQNVGRRGQIYVTWVNFTKEILFGTGYSNAAVGILPGYSRSNFQYTQILASNGIIFFIFYFYFLIKMFGSNIRNNLSLMMIIFGFSALMFYDWTLILSLAIISSLVYWGKRYKYRFDLI